MTRPSEAEVTELMSVGQCEACGGPTVSLARHICEPCKARALSTPPLPSAESVAKNPTLLETHTLLAIVEGRDSITLNIAEAQAMNRLVRDLATTPPAAAQDTVRLDAVVEAARKMPRRTPASGGAGTHHTFQISAASVWALDEALTALDAARAAGGE